MGMGIPDLKPLWEIMREMVAAFTRLAAAVEEQNELTKQQMEMAQ